MTGGQGSMSKLKAGDVTMRATTRLMDLVGPYAWSTECPLEKWFRDAKIYQLFEGTAEIQRMVISRMQVAAIPRAARLRRRDRGSGCRRGQRRRRRPRARSRLTRGSGSKLGPWLMSTASVRGTLAGATPSSSAAGTAGAGCGSRWRSTWRCWPSSSSAGSSPDHWRCSPTPGTCSPTSARSSWRWRRPGWRRGPAGRGGPSATSAPRSSRRSPTACTLVAVAVLIAIAAIGRLSDPPAIEAGGVLALGLLGLAGNAAATLVLVRGQRERHQPRGSAAPQRRRRARLARRRARRAPSSSPGARRSSTRSSAS